MKDIENMNLQEVTATQRKVFGVRLRIMRKNAGLTQKQLAERAGFKPPAVARYEAGQVLPRPDAVERLAGALGVPVSYLDGSNFSAAMRIAFADSYANTLKNCGIQANFSDDFKTIMLSGPGIGKISMSFSSCMDIVEKTNSQINALLAPLKMKYFRSLIKINLETSGPDALLAALQEQNPEAVASLEQLEKSSK